VSARRELAAAIDAATPRSWVVVPHEPDLDATIGKTTLYVSQQSIRRHPAAPKGKLLVTFTVRLICADKNVATREDMLETAVYDLVMALEGMGVAYAWQDADKVMHGAYLAYDVAVTVTASRPSKGAK
jgi:hypothetical protein